MGVNDGRPTAARVAGRGALTALAVAGGMASMASMASAAELPVQGILEGTVASMGHSHNATDGSAKQMADEVINVKHKVDDLNGSVDPTMLTMAGPSHKAQVDNIIDVKHKVSDLNGSVDPMMLDVAHQMDESTAPAAAKAPVAPKVTAPKVAKGNEAHVTKPDARQSAAQAQQAPNHVTSGLQQVNTGKINGASNPTSVLSFV